MPPIKRTSPARSAVLMQGGEGFEHFVRGTPEQLGARKELSPAERDAIVSAAAEAMDEAMPLILDEAAQITASTFTPAQLREMIAFYETDSGKAIAAKTSILPPMASQLVLSFAPILRADVVLRACAKMDCEAAPPLKV